MRRSSVGTLLGLALLAVPVATGPLSGQMQHPEVAPTVPAGTAVVLLPVQSASPTAGGAWPGGARSMSDALRTLEAELAFAFGEAEALEWVMPAEVVERTRRNPLSRVDPQRLAYQGLLRKPDPRVQLYEPLHGQLRMLSALFGARLVVLPLRLWYEPGRPVGATAGGPASSEESASTAAEEPGAEQPSTVADGPPPEAGRAVLLLAVVDTRRSAVLWHGTVEGDPGPATTSRLLTTLALRVASQMAQ